jgi:hypothetical protein
VRQQSSDQPIRPIDSNFDMVSDSLRAAVLRECKNIHVLGGWLRKWVKIFKNLGWGGFIFAFEFISRDMGVILNLEKSHVPKSFDCGEPAGYKGRIIGRTHFRFAVC